MTSPIPDEAVEEAARVMRRDGWTCEYHDPADDCDQCDRLRAGTARAMLTAAAPIITAQATEDPDHWAHTALAAQDAALTAQINGAVRWGRENESELADLRAGIEALRDEWLSESATAEGNARALDGQGMQDGARTERSYAMTVRRHADALDALLREGE